VSEPRHILYLVIEGLPAERRLELEKIAQEPGVTAEIFELTEFNSAVALEKIFAADSVAVWGPL
jgi:hypothetical protein